jgi:hypothetical protein
LGISLEVRTLLSGSAPGHQVVSIEVPGNYISQDSRALDVTLVRTTAGGRTDAKGTITVQFSATGATPTDQATPSFTPITQTVTFPAGQSTETVAIPMNPGAPNPGLVPVAITVTSSSKQIKGSSATVDIAASAAAIPPSIVGVQRVAGGIAISFSKPMDPKTVQNIHNYSVKFSPSQDFGFQTLYGTGLVQTLESSTQKISLRRATYNPATNTVLLVATEQLGNKGAYVISSPASLHSKKYHPGNAQPLTDTYGNVLDQGGTGGSFSVRIGKGKPYSAEPETLVSGD